MPCNSCERRWTRSWWIIFRPVVINRRWQTYRYLGRMPVLGPFGKISHWRAHIIIMVRRSGSPRGTFSVFWKVYSFYGRWHKNSRNYQAPGSYSMVPSQSQYQRNYSIIFSKRSNLDSRSLRRFSIPSSRKESNCRMFPSAGIAGASDVDTHLPAFLGGMFVKCPTGSSLVWALPPVVMPPTPLISLIRKILSKLLSFVRRIESVLSLSLSFTFCSADLIAYEFDKNLCLDCPRA